MPRQDRLSADLGFGNMQYVGGFGYLLNPYALLGGLATTSMFTLHGDTFLSLKTRGEIMERARRAAVRLWLPTVVLVFAYVIAGYFATDMFTRLGLNPGPVPSAQGWSCWWPAGSSASVTTAGPLP